MVKSTGENAPPLAPFLKKCYEMVEDESTDPIISWGSNSDTFVIWDMTQFSVQLLPKYFKHSNFSSFMRQLNIYGFRKVDTDRWEFANDGFIKGQKHLLRNIYRRKNLLAATDQNKSSPPPDIATKQVDKTKSNTALLKEVENLKNDKNALMQEFIKLRQLQESSENNLVMLRERLQGMEKNQQQMLSFLVMAMQNPGVLFQLLQVKESTWRMAERANVLEGEEDGEEEEEEEAIISEGTIVRYQPNTPIEPEIQISSASRLDKTGESDNQQHVDGGKDAFLSIDFLKRLMDEKFSLDSHGPVILPDLPDDGTWKDLLLAYPFVEKTTPQEEKQDYLPSTESFDLLLKQMENTEDDENEGVFDSDNGDTVQMQLWSSGTNPPAH